MFELPFFLKKHINAPADGCLSPNSIGDSSLGEPELEDLLSHLNQVYQVDLTGYKRSTLMRRTIVRMQTVGTGHYQDYLNYLQRYSDEVAHLLDTIFINYTYFFRDSLVWDYLADQVIPKLIANKAPNDPIRVWSAGCASGEETYSLAMLLIEALGIEQFQQRVQIYGTDVDPNAVSQARQGLYPARAAKLIPSALRKQYFERGKGRYRWRQDFRHSIHFQLHNLIQDPPLPHIDLLVCRNLLMYFTAETQLLALGRFHWSLQENGFLLLGKAENPVTPLQTSLFVPIDRPARVFTKVSTCSSK